MKTIADITKIPLIFIHGLKGARLVSSQGEAVWLRSKHALGLSTSKLRLPMRWIDARQPEDGLKPEKILRSFALIPYFYERNFYADWLAAAEQCQRPFYEFSYDWRRDNLETLERFNSFIKKIYQKYEAKIQVVAHSMGGLISFAMLNELTDLIHSVSFVGVPFRGGISCLQDMTLGAWIGLNSKILDSETLSSFPSMYSLFPLNAKGLVNDQDGREVSLDFYNAEDWKKHKAGFFSSEQNTELKMEFLSIALGQAKKFRKLLSAKLVNYPPIMVVNSRSFPTVEKVIFIKEQNRPSWNFKMGGKSPGDGRICEQDSLPPTGIQYTLYTSTYRHRELLNDPLLIRQTVYLEKIASDLVY